MNPADAAARLAQLSGQLRALAQNPPRGTRKRVSKLRGQRRAVQAKAAQARVNADFRTKIMTDVKKRLG